MRDFPEGAPLPREEFSVIGCLMFVGVIVVGCEA
jgi:hypothetical protein